MVRRSEAAKGEKKPRRKGGKPGRGNDDDDEGAWQQKGKLMLGNPLIPPELDEDIDDDLAFNSEDEQLYGEFFAKQTAVPPSKAKKTKKSSKATRPTEDDDSFLEDSLAVVAKSEKTTSKSKRASTKVDRHARMDDVLDNYHEEGQSSGDDDDYIDLSDMLDMSLKAEKEKKAKVKKATRLTETGTKVAKKRRSAPLTYEPESVFGSADASASGGATSYTKAMQRIMQQEGAADGNVNAVKNRIAKSFQNKHNLVAVDAEDSVKDRLTRKEVRSIVEEGMERYKPILKEIDSAKHLQLPMHLPDSTPVASSVGGIVAAADAQFRSDRAFTGAQASSVAYRLGSKIDALLSKAGLSRRQVAETADTPNSIGNYVKFDGGELHGAPPHGGDNDEKAPDTGYVAKLKAMLAYENSRRKRLNRIKSKTYRRILRKEKDRERERREKAFELLHPELARQRLADRLLKARVEERVTQKHKNTSAWVKHAKRFTQFDENAKDAIDEQHATHQRLMQKMDQDAGEENYERYMAGDNESEMSSEEDHVVDELIQKVSASGGAPLSRKTVKSILWSSVDAAEDENDTAGSKGSPIAKARAELRELNFMKNARDREERDYEQQMETLRRDIEAYQMEEREGDSMAKGEEEDTATAKKVQKSVASPSTPAGRLTFKKVKGGDAVEQVQLQKQGGIRISSNDGLTVSDDETAEHSDDVDSVRSCSSTEMKDRAPATRANDADKPQGKKNSSKTRAAAPPSSVSEFAGARKDAKPARLAVKKAVDSTRVTIFAGKRARQDGDEKETSETKVVDAAALKEHPDVAEEDLRLHQEYLISRAFAHDDIDEDFIKEKGAQVETIMRPEDKNQSLPGWGEWGGEDPKLNRHHQEVVQHLATQRQIEKSFLLKSRADAALEHVIINHDGVELVPDRMTLHMVPRPFSNPKEFARSMRQPVGPEWTSALSFKDGVQPRVEVRQGQAVLPLDLSLRKPKTKTKRRKTDASVPRAA